MASILPKCPHCGSHHVTQTYCNPDTKERRFVCIGCGRKFTEKFVSVVYKTEAVVCPRCNMPDRSFVEHECDNSLGHVETRRCRHCKTAFSTIDGIAQRINKIGNTLEQDMRLEIGDMIYGGLG